MGDLLGPTLTLVEKFSKVLPTVTYSDFGPPSLRFRLRLPFAFATLRRNQTARQVVNRAEIQGGQ
jgi:hypothetical protein